jgi:PhnB protein
MQINPYLNFSGQCEEAINFYVKVLGGKIDHIMRYDEMPDMHQITPETAKHVMHSQITVGGNVIMASDAPAPYFQKAQGITVALNVDTPAEAERIYAELSDGAESIMMELGETAWALRFAMFTDRYGTPWLINCSRPQA